LGEQALDIGAGVHLPIYASKDQYAAWLHALLLMPNVRDANAIAHYYLDLVQGRGCKSISPSSLAILTSCAQDLISIQLTTDQGTEVSEMLKIHKHLRYCRIYIRLSPFLSSFRTGWKLHLRLWSQSSATQRLSQARKILRLSPFGDGLGMVKGGPSDMYSKKVQAREYSHRTNRFIC
jgi:hypothetical protein